jgi:DNA-binding response OmpR family regulator
VRILLVEDDDAFASALGDGLGGRGYHVTRASSGAAALAALQSGPRADLILLDLGLPDGDGLALCARIRRQFSLPVIMVTARGDLSSRVQGLRGGADDYVVKPFALAELLARVEAVMRRAPATEPASGPVSIGELTIDVAARRVSVAGTALSLTLKEFDLLVALARAPGCTVDRQRLLMEVWHSDYPALTRTLDVHIATLRAKLGRPQLVETVRGVGYRLAAPEAAAELR